LARITRGAMLGVLSADYIRTARALGLSRSTIVLHYALSNALVSIITTLGMIFSYMLGPMSWSRRFSPGPASAPMRSMRS